MLFFIGWLYRLYEALECLERRLEQPIELRKKGGSLAFFGPIEHPPTRFYMGMVEPEGDAQLTGKQTHFTKRFI